MRRRDVVGAPDRGMRFKPRCGRRWFLEIALAPDFAGTTEFTLIPSIVPGGNGTSNPWTSIDPAITTAVPPEPVPEPAAAVGAVAATLALARLARRGRPA
ncbi:MAG: hypothetical protein NTZ61_01800 [Proteobacteria bacterium]|nr:hypothetical protein [Pseudomonadota bacterium]